MLFLLKNPEGNHNELLVGLRGHPRPVCSANGMEITIDRKNK